VQDAKKICKKNGMEADNSKDDTDSSRGTAQYYENMRKSHSNNSNNSDSLYSLYPQRMMSLPKARSIPLK
jgi:hypothetical protein